MFLSAVIVITDNRSSASPGLRTGAELEIVTSLPKKVQDVCVRSLAWSSPCRRLWISDILSFTPSRHIALYRFLENDHITHYTMAPASQQLFIPDLLSICNLQSDTNPHEDVVRAETEKWVSSYGIFTDAKWSKFLESDVPRFASRTYSYADYEKLRDCSDFCLLMFALDDITDDEDKKEGTLTSQASIHAMQSDGPVLSSSPGERMIKEYVRSSILFFKI